MTTGVVPFWISTGVSGGLAAMGGWVVLFGTNRGRISREAERGKRVSGWPFGNKEVGKKKKGKGL